MPSCIRLLALSLVALSLGASALQVLSSPAQAQRFGSTVVSGVSVLAGNPNPAKVFENRMFLSSAALCRDIHQNKPLLDQIVNQAIGALNQKIAERVKGVALVRYEFMLSKSCSAVVDGTTVGNPQGGLGLQLKLPANRFVTNITTPDVGILGTRIGLPQGADPRIEISFDIEVAVRLSVPRTLNERLRAGSATAAIHNVGLPKGLNFSGKLVGAAADAATSVYDYFNKGEIGRRLSAGQAFSKVIPDSVLDPVNKALDPYRKQLSVIEVRVDPAQALLILHATDGKKVADPRCIQGYVWREVRAGDQVCVKPEVRAQVRADNKLAGERRADKLNTGVLGACGVGKQDAACVAKAYRIPCKQGFVWREAVADDYVCVTPVVRQQAKEDNAAERRRRMDYEAVIR
jgi:hypothetical protein